MIFWLCGVCFVGDMVTWLDGYMVKCFLVMW